jgi:hypothetical protein
MSLEQTLGPEDVLRERPFTDPVHTEREVGVMQAMLHGERARARAWIRDGGRGRERLVREVDDEGHRHLLLVPDIHVLVTVGGLTAVGFFGRPRSDSDHTILFELEDELLGRLPSYAGAGLLSYYDVELVKGAYGNLILFSTPDVPPEWHADPVHLRAIELSPGHYHEVRLHKGSIQGRLLDDGEIAVERTKYFDFDSVPEWHGVRKFRNLSR